MDPQESRPSVLCKDPHLGANQRAALEAFVKQFDPVEAEREYRDMLENGGIPWEQLVSDLEEINRRFHQGGDS